MITLNNVISFQRFLKYYDLHLWYEQVSPDYYGVCIQNKHGDTLQRDWLPVTGWGTTEAKAYSALVQRLSDYKYAFIRGECVGLPTPILVDAEWVEHDGYWTLDTFQGWVALVLPTVYFIYDGTPENVSFQGSCKNLEDGKKQVEVYYDY